MKTAIALIAVLALASACSKKEVSLTADAAPEVTGEQLCRANLTSFVSFKDPDSVRILSIAPNVQRPGRYLMSVSAKNSMGGYADPTSCTCGTAAGAVTDMHCDNPAGV